MKQKWTKSTNTKEVNVSEKFGASVNLFDKTDALVHISEMDWTRTNNVEDLWWFVDVKVIKIDERSCR